MRFFFQKKSSFFLCCVIIMSFLCTFRHIFIRWKYHRRAVSFDGKSSRVVEPFLSKINKIELFLKKSGEKWGIVVEMYYLCSKFIL